MTDVLAIDPGSVQSAWVLWNGRTVTDHGKQPNAEVLRMLRCHLGEPVLVVEAIASYGMPVGADVFQTVWWAGRFYEAWDEIGLTATQLTRMEVKMHLCGNSRAKDANIRQAILDRFGGKAQAIGRKASPGLLHGITADRWAALALALTYADRRALGHVVGF